MSDRTIQIIQNHVNSSRNSIHSFIIYNMHIQVQPLLTNLSFLIQRNEIKIWS